MRPETTLFGLSAWFAHDPATGVTAWRASRENHWLWEGTGLHEGDPFSAVGATEILDGTFLQWQDGLPYVAQTELTLTAAHTLILASLPTDTAIPWWCHDQGIAACQQPGWGAIAIRQDPVGVSSP